MIDIKEQLLKGASKEPLHHPNQHTMRDAAARIEALEAENRTLKNYGITAQESIEALEAERDELKEALKGIEAGAKDAIGRSLSGSDAFGRFSIIAAEASVALAKGEG